KRNKTSNNIIIKKKLKEWKKYKPRGYIEDFFKVCKQAFNMHKIHKYKPESFTKYVFLRVLLINQAINTTEKTKTALQQLSQQ
ncbi:transposase, partial [Methanosphaera sp. DEW79]|uniref:transposase n=1 Tax=Methanosphaera sp. DEW79 TaxID=1945576 RepID=UPI000DC51502